MYIEKRAHRSPCLKNCAKAFFVGGIICTLGELMRQLFVFWGASAEDSSLYASLSLIFLSGLLTGIGVFDRIANFGGGGALVPITGFSNAVVSPAMESKTEGWITGVGSKMFVIAGPVVVYGTASSVLFGVIYLILLKL